MLPNKVLEKRLSVGCPSFDRPAFLLRKKKNFSGSKLARQNVLENDLKKGFSKIVFEIMI